jgi:hypothetical protein
MRGIVTDGIDPRVWANLSSAENTGDFLFKLNATGFQPESLSDSINASSQTYIYIAIRRGPMKVPTSGTSVFYANAISQAETIDSTNVPFPPDLVNTFSRNGTDRTSQYNQFQFVDRLRGLGTPSNTFSGNGGPSLLSASTAVEASAVSYVQLKADSQNITRGTGWNSASYGNWINYFFRRAPSFFDEVCYTGTGASGQNITHNLAAVPELMIVKCRNDSGRNWQVYSAPLGNGYRLALNQTLQALTTTIWDSTTPTSTQFRVSSDSTVGANTFTYVAYLFATCAGVSKCFSYTGNGSSQTINCGFTGGARWILIKRTDSTGDWYCWDSARGIVSGNDPHLSLNTTAAEVTTDDSVDTDSTGFIVNQLSATDINVSSATYIGIAIA